MDNIDASYSMRTLKLIAEKFRFFKTCKCFAKPVDSFLFYNFLSFVVWGQSFVLNFLSVLAQIKRIFGASAFPDASEKARKTANDAGQNR